MMKTLRALLLLVVFAATAAMSQTITVSSPNSGDVLGRTNSVKFLIENASFQARVVATATKNDDATTKFSNEGLFDPDSARKISGSLNLNFDESTPLGTYTLKVDYYSQGTLRNSVTISNLTVDARNPKFRFFTPANNSFVGSSVPIRAEVEETNMKLWQVRVNDRDIPNNQGTSSAISVQWNTSNIETDGSQTISIKVEDQAQNSNTRTLNVTLDRVSPSITVGSPTTINYRPRSVIPVVIQVGDQYQGSVINQAVSVKLYTMDGQYIGRAARRSAQASGSTLLWVGRIRLTNSFPNQFKVVVEAYDRAGNKAQNQEVTVTVAGG
ncbi:MAG: hypothetical protein JST40_06925 [Armatimonadetes bacterium]|nr:hypothetical protein [Armatimonadota bacterium]